MLKKKEETKEEKKKKSLIEDLFGTFIRITPKEEKPKKKPKEDPIKMIEEKKKALADSKKTMWTTYKNYKKAHGFLAW